MIQAANSPLRRPRLQERRQAKPDGPSKLMRREVLTGRFRTSESSVSNIRSHCRLVKQAVSADKGMILNAVLAI